jgi:hypothetical protein
MLCQRDRKITKITFFRRGKPELYSERSRFARRKTVLAFAAHINNSRRHNGTKVTNALGKANVIRVSHSVYSPRLNASDFRLFGTFKHRMMDRQLQNSKEILLQFQNYAMRLLLKSWKMFSWSGGRNCNGSFKTADTMSEPGINLIWKLLGLMKLWIRPHCLLAT